MKKILVIISLIVLSASAQDGNIIFANRNIPILSGAGTGGGNGNGTYNVPIWQYGSTTAGAGSLAGGYTMGLFLAGASDTAIPLAAVPLRTDANSQFFASAATTVTVTGQLPGTTPTLMVRGWQGVSFAAAKAGAGQWVEWTFTPKPLGGTPAGGGTPIPTPSMTGWGPEDGSGIVIVPEPSTIALGALGLGILLVRRGK